jgi:carbamoyltransferase
MQNYFDFDRPSPYMLFTAPIATAHRKPQLKNLASKNWREQLYQPHSDIPAVTHVDYSARLQTVSKETNPLYHQLITAFKKKTGYGLVVNTSFNVRGEPIVCTPEEAFRCFLSTGMDCLAIGSCFLEKEEQRHSSKMQSAEEKLGAD